MCSLEAGRSFKCDKVLVKQRYSKEKSERTYELSRKEVLRSEMLKMVLKSKLYYPV